jgi:hypothetical protein
MDADYCADKKQPISTGLGALLPVQNVIAFQPEVVAKPRKVKGKRA